MIKFSIIISETTRSLYYLIKLLENKLTPNHIYYFSNNKKISIDKNLFKKKSLKNITYKLNYYGSNLDKAIDNIKARGAHIHKFKNLSVNSEKFFNFLKKDSNKLIVFSGYPGQILSEKFFFNKYKFLHIHAGYLPNYKGSTANYYSILNGDVLGFSAIFMNKKIDDGDIIIREKHNIPSEPELYDIHYDNFFRSELLVKAINHINKSKKIIKNKYTPQYYIIHPVLKMLAYKKMLKKI